MSIHEPRGELDLLAVQRDDEQLDALSRRTAREPKAADVLGLLAALAADVDEGLAGLLASPLRVPTPSEDPAEVSTLADGRRRRAARAVTAAFIVTGLASVSGVSAAVTGDPFSPYRSVISVVSGDDEQRPKPRGLQGDAVRQQVLSIDAAIDAGQLGRAQAGVEKLRATLADKPRGAQRAAIARLAALEAKLARAVAKDTNTSESTRGVDRPAAVAPQPKPTVVAPGPARPGNRATDRPAKPQEKVRPQDAQEETSPAKPQQTKNDADATAGQPAGEARPGRSASKD